MIISNDAMMRKEESFLRRRFPNTQGRVMLAFQLQEGCVAEDCSLHLRTALSPLSLSRAWAKEQGTTCAVTACKACRMAGGSSG